MKKMNKKGFTIVELVIVIAVIAILAAVLIPTFASLVSKADESAALQEATAVHNKLLVNFDADLDVNDDKTAADLYIEILDDDGKVTHVYSVTDGKLALVEGTVTLPNDNYKAYTPAAGEETIEGAKVYIYGYTAPTTTPGNGD